MVGISTVAARYKPVSDNTGHKLRYHPVLDGPRTEFYSLPLHPNFTFPYQELAITSDEALSLDELPKRAVILGGGYILPLNLLQYGEEWVQKWIYLPEGTAIKVAFRIHL
ncbi:hypothetical protein B296_00036582 [Ensete ventricosum]|uniref:Uncharacterized protein n=1 Tax=Ensete ventricosum TaxID=4639 RepID=A0A427A265_ENSVE|nr:hypothetical protein B296_00036582 [Ensete ventricosum]